MLAFARTADRAWLTNASKSCIVYCSPHSGIEHFRVVQQAASHAVLIQPGTARCDCGKLTGGPDLACCDCLQGSPSSSKRKRDEHALSQVCTLSLKESTNTSLHLILPTPRPSSLCSSLRRSTSSKAEKKVSYLCYWPELKCTKVSWRSMHKRLWFAKSAYQGLVRCENTSVRRVKVSHRMRADNALRLCPWCPIACSARPRGLGLSSAR